MCINANTNRLAHTDRVGELDFASIRQTGCNDVLCDVASHIGGASVHLGRILAAKCATAMSPPSTVGIDNDLSACQTAIAVRATDYKVSGWVDVVGDVVLDHAGRQARLHDLFDDELSDFLLSHVWSMLR